MVLAVLESLMLFADEEHVRSVFWSEVEDSGADFGGDDEFKIVESENDAVVKVCEGATVKTHGKRVLDF